MYEYLLTIKVTLRLPWRAAVGFAEGLLMKAFPNKSIKVPDYAHASREAAKLKIKIRSIAQNAAEGLELAFDSTGDTQQAVGIKENMERMHCTIRENNGTYSNGFEYKTNNFCCLYR